MTLPRSSRSPLANCCKRPAAARRRSELWHASSKPSPVPAARCAAFAAPPYALGMAIQIRTTLAEPDTAETYVPHRPARPEKAEGGKSFVLQSDYEPAGDQPQAIKELTGAAGEGEKNQVLLGVTGSG